ncbi:unknown protein [Microcystis aeruginosa NIES-843]|uniref:Uncharacterized protein n=1 Tax=Microcystis aeruginosa (strain NIES-843 / IAM M-2473) TaxID=449447 RepID=B0JKS0_MICAN|nr:unknown protein [Microcystis aeruginosa NIES-843]
MPFYISVPSLITPVHCITQTEEPKFSKLCLSNGSNQRRQITSNSAPAASTRPLP